MTAVVTSGAAPPGIARRAIRVRGAVQGVGFRPFVWRLAHELRLDGFVRNDAQGVAIEVQGEPGMSVAVRSVAPPAFVYCGGSVSDGLSSSGCGGALARGKSVVCAGLPADAGDAVSQTP